MTKSKYQTFWHLSFKIWKMAVSLSDPVRPKSDLRILTTTLRIQTLKPIPNYSKAPGVFSSCCRYPASSRESHFHRACRWDSSPVVTPFVRFRTYLKRKCATLERFFTLSLASNLNIALDEILIVAYEIGLYHLQSTIGVWRIVSEDSFIGW